MCQVQTLRKTRNQSIRPARVERDVHRIKANVIQSKIDDRLLAGGLNNVHVPATGIYCCDLRGCKREGKNERGDRGREGRMFIAHYLILVTCWVKLPGTRRSFGIVIRCSSCSSAEATSSSQGDGRSRMRTRPRQSLAQVAGSRHFLDLFWLVALLRHFVIRYIRTDGNDKTVSQNQRPPDAIGTADLVDNAKQADYNEDSSQNHPAMYSHERSRTCQVCGALAIAKWSLVPVPKTPWLSFRAQRGIFFVPCCCGLNSSSPCCSE